MIIVDNQIKDLVKSKNLITNFNEENLSSISYDVTINEFVGNEDKGNYILSPNSFVYIKTNESLNIPYNLCSKVIEKNSLMRKGLKVDGPLYQPGHQTDIFLRIQNISNEQITLEKDMKIAQLIFIKLDNIPTITYDKQENARYNNENEFRN